MPYQSEAQERWAHTPEGMKALGGPSKVHEWDETSKGMKLPMHKDQARKIGEMLMRGPARTESR